MVKKLNMNKNPMLIKAAKIRKKKLQIIMKQLNKINQWKLIHHNEKFHFIFV
jgi:hypothetical protein